jgi:hypothetical protein
MTRPTWPATWRDDKDVRPASDYVPGERVWAEVAGVWHPAVIVATSKAITTSKAFVTVRYRAEGEPTTTRLRLRSVVHGRTETIADLDGEA